MIISYKYILVFYYIKFKLDSLICKYAYDLKDNTLESVKHLMQTINHNQPTKQYRTETSIN